MSISSGIAFLEHNVALDDFVPVNTLEPLGKIGPFFSPLCFGSWRWRKDSYDFAALADTHRFTLFDPGEDAAEIVPQLPNRGGLHV